MPALLWTRSLPKSLGIAHRQFSVTACSHSHRAFVFSETGTPSAVIRAVTYDSLPNPPPGTLNLRVLLSAINPADINVLQGVYPTKPVASTLPGVSGQLFVAGNEGVAEITALGAGSDHNDFSIGDWVIIAKPQSGLWSSARNARIQDVIKVPRKQGLSIVHAAMMTVNPTTAYNMLNNFVDLKEGEWIVQNAANSAVGQAVIQIAKSRGIKTLNLIRDRTEDEAEKMKCDLKALGADLVCMYGSLADKSRITELKRIMGHQSIRLALNCVGGEVTTRMLKLVGRDANLVSYGAMAKQPISIPTSYFIFKNLKAHGFWQHQWYESHSRQKRIEVVEKLAQIMADGYLKEPKHEVVTISADATDRDATEQLQVLLSDAEKGSLGRKILLRIEDPH